MQYSTQTGIPIRDVLSFYLGCNCFVPMYGEKGLFQALVKINYFDPGEDIVVVTHSIGNTDEIHYVSPDSINLSLNDFYDMTNEHFGEIIKSNFQDEFECDNSTLVFHERPAGVDYRKCTWLLNGQSIATFKMNEQFVLEMTNHIENDTKFICPPGHVIRMACKLGYYPFI